MPNEGGGAGGAAATAAGAAECGVAGMMQRLLTVLNKEIVDNIRDRRALFTALLLGPLLAPAMLGAVIVFFSVQVAPAEREHATMPVLGSAHAPDLMRFLEGHGVMAEELDGSAARDPEAAVRSGEIDYAVLVPEDFGERLADGRTVTVRVLSDGSRTRLQMEQQRTTRLIEGWSERLAAQRLMARGLSAELRRPLAVEREDVSTARQRGAMLLAILPYALVFGMFMGGFYLAIDVTAGERERGTLEALLTAPLSRAELVLGKWLAVAAFCAFALCLAISVFAVGLPHLPWAGMGLSPQFGAREAGIALVNYLPLALLAAALLTLVASFTTSFKEAQSWLSVLAMAPLAPLIMHFIEPIEASLPVMLVPVAAQQVLVLDLLRGDAISGWHMATAMGAVVLWTALALALAIRLYRRERILGAG